jgi:hypothetical protein
MERHYARISSMKRERKRKLDLNCSRKLLAANRINNTHPTQWGLPHFQHYCNIKRSMDCCVVLSIHSKTVRDCITREESDRLNYYRKFLKSEKLRSKESQILPKRFLCDSVRLADIHTYVHKYKFTVVRSVSILIHCREFKGNISRVSVNINCIEKRTKNNLVH